MKLDEKQMTAVVGLMDDYAPTEMTRYLGASLSDKSSQGKGALERDIKVVEAKIGTALLTGEKAVSFEGAAGANLLGVLLHVREQAAKAGAQAGVAEVQDLIAALTGKPVPGNGMAPVVEAVRRADQLQPGKAYKVTPDGLK